MNNEVLSVVLKYSRGKNLIKALDISSYDFLICSRVDILMQRSVLLTTDSLYGLSVMLLKKNNIILLKNIIRVVPTWKRNRLVVYLYNKQSCKYSKMLLRIVINTKTEPEMNAYNPGNELCPSR